jgi:hypothetical protein
MTPQKMPSVIQWKNRHGSIRMFFRSRPSRCSRVGLHHDGPNKSLEDDGGSPVLFVSFLLLIVTPYRRRASALRSAVSL